MRKYICILLPFMLLSCSKEAYNFKEQLPRTIITYPQESVEKTRLYSRRLSMMIMERGLPRGVFIMPRVQNNSRSLDSEKSYILPKG